MVFIFGVVGIIGCYISGCCLFFLLLNTMLLIPGIIHNPYIRDKVDIVHNKISCIYTRKYSQKPDIKIFVFFHSFCSQFFQLGYEIVSP